MQRNARGPVSRVLFRTRYAQCKQRDTSRTAAAIRLGHGLLHGSSSQPGWSPFARGAKHPCPLARARHPYSALLRVGFTMRAALPKPRCALTAPFHPCLIPRTGHRRYALCGTFPMVAHGGRYPPPLFRGARTFLATRSHAAARPPGAPSDRSVHPPRQAKPAMRYTDRGICKNSAHQLYV